MYTTSRNVLISWKNVTFAHFFFQIRYSIKPYGPDYDKFAINPESGVVTTRDTFDRERKDEYYLTVVAQDGAKSDRPFHLPAGSPNQGKIENQLFKNIF